MKKLLPLILLFFGALVVAGAYFFVFRSDKTSEDIEDESALIDVDLKDRPILSLTPRSDGHWLDMKIEKLTLPAKTLEYELLYELPDGRMQGVPGSVDIEGKNIIEAELLLGSESSGKFRYDEGVEKGSMTISFRNSSGKLMAKFSSEFHLQTETDTFTSADGNFSYSLDDDYEGFVVAMPTIGLPVLPDGELKVGPYGIFSSSGDLEAGKIETKEGEAYYYSDSWVKADGNSGDGIFIGL